MLYGCFSIVLLQNWLGGALYRLREIGAGVYVVRQYEAGGYKDLFEGSYDNALAILNALRDIETANDSLRLANEAFTRLDNNIVARTLLGY